MDKIFTDKLGRFTLTANTEIVDKDRAGYSFRGVFIPTKNVKKMYIDQNSQKLWKNLLEEKIIEAITNDF